MNEINIRIASVEDTTELLRIYEYYVLNTAISFEHVPPSQEEFADRIKNVLQKYPYLVAEIEGKVVGYAYASTFKTRESYQWNIETSIYIDKEYKHKGIGKKLYEVLEKILKLQNVLNMNAGIAYPESEDEYLKKDSFLFHKQMGYGLVGEYHKVGFKFNRWYNLIYMEKHIGEHIANPPKVIWFKDLPQKQIDSCLLTK